MTATLPFITAYDPPATSEGTLDPLGVYQIADQLAVKLVPAVRERMLRVRFLTPMAVGTFVTEGLDGDPRNRDANPYLVWEWMVVEALVRHHRDSGADWGLPGMRVARNALSQHGYVDARSYLKTPRVFGFHGVYKRLAVHLGLVNVHLAAGPNAEALIDAWARGLGMSSLEAAKPLLRRWSDAVRRGLSQSPPRTKPSWNAASWQELAESFAPTNSKSREKRHLRELLHRAEDRGIGALPHLWKLQVDFDDQQFNEEALHQRLAKVEPGYGPLIEAIRAYEAFARSLQDAFDILKSEAAAHEMHGFVVTDIAGDAEFKRVIRGLDTTFREAHRALGEVAITNLSLQNLFAERFAAFADPLDAGAAARCLCTHHEAVQRAKSADGKRPWFDRIGPDRIFVRQAYREPRRECLPGRYVHGYRGWPIRRFASDLA
jgi:hypothetical protein